MWKYVGRRQILLFGRRDSWGNELWAAFRSGSSVAVAVDAAAAAAGGGSSHWVTEASSFFWGEAQPTHRPLSILCFHFFLRLHPHFAPAAASRCQRVGYIGSTRKKDRRRRKRKRNGRRKRRRRPWRISGKVEATEMATPAAVWTPIQTMTDVDALGWDGKRLRLNGAIWTSDSMQPRRAIR